MPRRSIEERIWPKVRYTPDCWLWTGAVDRGGYGMIRWGSKPDYAHRVLYRLFVGPIREGFEIDHLCGVRNCVNPEHLEPVTRAENNRRAVERRPRAVFCIAGHLLNEENRYRNRCRECQRRRTRAWHKRRAAIT